MVITTKLKLNRQIAGIRDLWNKYILFGNLKKIYHLWDAGKYEMISPSIQMLFWIFWCDDVGRIQLAQITVQCQLVH